MSVVKSKRNLSSLEFFHNALVLRKSMTDLLMRDFGVKAYRRNIKYIAKVVDMSEEDEDSLKTVFEKYGINKAFLDSYPRWLIDKEREYLLDTLRDLSNKIVKANSIYPVNMNEYYVRRNLQNDAIGDCEDLLQEMQYILTIMPVDAEKYMPFVEMIEKEIALLKGWRKSDNKIAQRLQATKSSTIG